MRAQVIYNQENQKSINIDLLAGNKIGPQGLKGDSAYTVAKKNGFSGTEEQWLASLKGQTGDIGPQGQKGDKGDTGNLNFYICSSSEYDSETRKPTVSNPDGNTFYLVPAELETSPDLFVEWIYVNNKWEMFGSATVDLSDYITDVQIDGNSIVNNGVATIPQASAGVFGVISINEYTSATGLQKDPSGYLKTAKASSDTVKAGTNVYQVIVPSNQHESTFYGLAKAAGDTTQSQSSNAVGTYTETAQSKIHEMLDAPVTVSGITPTITGKTGIRYICGEVSTLSITAPESGCIDVIFTSGSTPTVLTVTSAKTGVTAIKWMNGFDPTALDANTTYELNILDGELGVAGSWT